MSALTVCFFAVVKLRKTDTSLCESVLFLFREQPSQAAYQFLNVARSNVLIWMLIFDWIFFTARVYVQRTKVVYLIHLRPFGTCKVNWHFKKKFLQRALPFVWKTRKSRGEFKWNGSSRSKFSGKKVIPFEVLPFSRFYRNDRNFLYHLFGLPGPGFKSKESEKFTGIL